MAPSTKRPAARKRVFRRFIGRERKKRKYMAPRIRMIAETGMIQAKKRGPLVIPNVSCMGSMRFSWMAKSSSLLKYRKIAERENQASRWVCFCFPRSANEIAMLRRRIAANQDGRLYSMSMLSHGVSAAPSGELVRRSMACDARCRIMKRPFSPRRE